MVKFEYIHNKFHEEIESSLRLFKSIDLGELDECRLMSRFDRKFLFSIDNIPEILENLGQTYSILEVEDRRLMKYKTLYYDTNDLEMYHAHHNGRGNRYKIRLREYADTGIKFLEIKHKNNKGEVSKYRTPFSEINGHFKMYEDFIRCNSPFNLSLLKPGVQTTFNRFTLVNFDLRERITIDSGLSFFDNGHGLDVPALAVAEIKSAERNLKSPFFLALRDMRIKEKRFSKYCAGTALLRPGIRQNIFKLQLKKLNQQQDEFFKSYRGSIVSGYPVYQP